MGSQQLDAQVTRFADMFSAMGTEPRLRIMRLLLSAHPDGMIVSDIGSELAIPASTLSHHLGKLRAAGIVDSERKGLWAYYYVIPDALKELSAWLS